MMQTTNDPREFNSRESSWNYLAEYSLSEIVLGEDSEFMLLSGPVFLSMQELGLPPESLKRIARTIKETVRHILSKGRNIPVCIRLFHQPKMVAGLPHSGKQREGGWGFFVIQRGEDPLSGIYGEPFSIIELYIYREGK